MLHTQMWKKRELPPRARRILKLTFNVDDLEGTTSACAENTDRPGGWRGHHRNYLRVRGEYNTNAHAYMGMEELPPRARRIPNRGGRYEDFFGTTSACAENTSLGMAPH